MLIVCFITFLYILTFVPESPKWYYSQKRYDESREELEYVAKFN